MGRNVPPSFLPTRGGNCLQHPQGTSRFQVRSGLAEGWGRTGANARVSWVGRDGASEVLGEMEAHPRAGGRWGGESSQPHSSFASGCFCNR